MISHIYFYSTQPTNVYHVVVGSAWANVACILKLCMQNS